VDIHECIYINIYIFRCRYFFYTIIILIYVTLQREETADEAGEEKRDCGCSRRINLNSRFARMLTGFQTPTGPADVFFSRHRRTAVVDPVVLGMLNVADHHQSRRYRQT